MMNIENQIKNEDLKIELRILTKDDYLGLKSSMMETYAEWAGASIWDEVLSIN